MTALFITATGTDAGKTFVTCGLVRALRARGGKVSALKPVLSGFDPASPDGSDSALLLAALGRPASADNIAATSPWRFAAPLSPDMAARRERRAIDFGALVAFCRRGQSAGGTLLIEGVGGVMVPLDARHTVLDWIVALDVPVLLVTGSYLGALSHALTAVDVLLARRRALAAIVVSESQASTVPLDETIDTLTRFVPDIDVLGLPRLPAGGTEHATFARLAARL